MLKLIFGTKPKAKKAKVSNKPLRSNTYTADYGKVRRHDVYNSNHGIIPFPNAYIQC